jgi:alkaline phosphatase
MGEYLKRTQGKSLGLVTTSDVFDATPAAWATHTQSRGAGTGICDQYYDDRNLNGLTVLMGGGRKWFLPRTEPGSQRSNNSDYILPEDIVAGWVQAPEVWMRIEI